MEKSIGSSVFTDVNFQLDDGEMKTHRAMLIARCDMMRAMLSKKYDFREAHAHTASPFISFKLMLLCNAEDEIAILLIFTADHISGGNKIFVP